MPVSVKEVDVEKTIDTFVEILNRNQSKNETGKIMKNKLREKLSNK